MAYDYNKEKSYLFTDEGQREFLQVRDNVKRLLEEAGAFSTCKAWKGVSGDSWQMLAMIDRLVELKEIREISQYGVSQQARVFVEA